MELLRKENGVNSGEVVEQIQQRLAQLSQRLGVQLVEVLCVEEGEVCINGGWVEKKKGAVQLKELGEAPMDRCLIPPQSFQRDGENDGREALGVFRHQRSDSLKHHMMLFPLVFCLPTITTSAMIHESEDVVFLGTTVCHLKQARRTVQQLTVLPGQVLAV